MLISYQLELHLDVQIWIVNHMHFVSVTKNKKTETLLI